jgi:multidrug efflux pump subunit AcrB
LVPKAERSVDRTTLATTLRLHLMLQEGPRKERSEGQQESTGAEFRFSIPSVEHLIPVYGFPIEFMIEDRADQPVELLLSTAKAMVEQMEASGQFTDVEQGLRSTAVPTVDVDRAKCMARGVDPAQAFEAVQFCLGSVEAGNFVRMGRTWQVHVGIDDDAGDRASLLNKLQVKNSQNELVPLAAVASIHEARGSEVVERHNLYRATRVTANLAGGVRLAEARKLCESLAARELGASFKLVWVSTDPARK